jgi:hypothetical protein
VTVAWQWLRQAIAAERAARLPSEADACFYRRKLATFRYFGTS